jgi:arsenate reductase (thioredoxin)
MQTVLFVCVHNAGRSQMAEAFFNQMAQGKSKAVSAGSQPTETVNPIVTQAMQELGIDISQNKPKLLTIEMLEQANIVISMGCGEDAACPTAFVETEDWGVEDPQGKSLPQVRVIRDEIKNKIFMLLRKINSVPK